LLSGLYFSFHSRFILHLLGLNWLRHFGKFALFCIDVIALYLLFFLPPGGPFFLNPVGLFFFFSFYIHIVLADIL